MTGAASKLYDVLVIGGGPAGLTAAGAIARQVHTALVIDSGEYRNAPTKHMHNVPGFDHADPADFRARVRGDLERRYETVDFVGAKVSSVRRVDTDGEFTFEARSDDGRVFTGKKLALGTGVRDLVEEEVEGYAECWGKGIFHCLFCHGFEERGADSVGVLAGGFIANADMVAHVSRMAKRLAKSVTIYTNGNADIATALPSRIHSTKIIVDPRPVKKFALVDGGPRVQVTLEDGETVTQGFVVSHPNVRQRADDLTKQLGLEMTPTGEIKVNAPFNETSVPGCFAAGDATTMMRSVVQSMTMGAFAAVGAIGAIQHELDLKDEL